MKYVLSILPSKHLSGCLLGIWSWDFSEFCHKLETLMKFCMTAWFFGKTFFAQKLEKWAKDFFNLKRKLVSNFHWTCLFFVVSLHKSYIWKKSCSRDIGQHAPNQSDCMVFKGTISAEQIEQIWSPDSKVSDFLHVGTNLCKLKGDWKF